MELLLALVLTGMIMTAAFGAVQLSWKYRSAGDAQVEQSQTVRGVLQDITLDLRSTAIPVQTTIDDQVSRIEGLPDDVAIMFRQLVREEGNTNDSSGPDIEERVLDFDSIDIVDPIHFYGESDFLVMLSTSENYRFAGSIHQHDTPMSHVVWSGSRASTIRVPFSIRNNRLDFTTVLAEANQTGLIRIQQPLPSAATQATATSQSNSIVPDAVNVSFRYSNGFEWQSKWNSHESKQLPTAIELKFRRKQFPEPQRFIIRLPQSNPT